MSENYLEQCKAYRSTFINNIEVPVGRCGAKAIEMVMGAEWFTPFKAQEMALGKAGVLEEKFTTIHDCDFQAVIKTFRFREDGSHLREKSTPEEIKEAPLTIEKVYEHWKLPRKKDPTKKDGSEFTHLCKELNEARNLIHHIPSNLDHRSELELRKDLTFIQNTMSNCLIFLNYFKTITNEKGESYFNIVHQAIKKLEETYKNACYLTEQVIQEEKLNVTLVEFNQICDELFISTSADNGMHYFYSSNYEADIRAIRAVVNSRAKKKGPLPFVLVGVGAAIVIALLLALLLGGDDTKGSPYVAGSTATTTTTNLFDNLSSWVNNQSGLATQATTGAPTQATLPTEQSSEGNPVYDGLVSRVVSISAEEIHIELENTGPYTYHFGWVDPSQVTIVTTTGEYYTELAENDIQLKPNESLTLPVNLKNIARLDGEVQSIKIANIIATRGSYNSVIGSTITIPIAE